MCVCVCVHLPSCVQLFATPGTLAHQALLSIGFSRQEYGVGCHYLLQGIFQIKELNLDLLHCRRILYLLSYQGSTAQLIKWQFKIRYLALKLVFLINDCCCSLSHDE